MLVVCPAALVLNWARELDTWGYFRVAICYGTSKDQVCPLCASPPPSNPDDSPSQVILPSSSIFL